MATCAIFHDGQFWTGILEWEDGGELRVVRRVFGAEPSEDDILRFVAAVRPEDGAHAPASTKSQFVLAAERERRAGELAGRRRTERREERERQFRLSQEKTKQKRRGH